MVCNRRGCGRPSRIAVSSDVPRRLGRSFDFPGTLDFGAALNLAAAAVTLVLVRGRKESFAAPVAPTSESIERAESSTPAPTINTRWLLLGAAFGTAVASFAYEIAWIRMLSLVFGSATHSFE